MANGWEGRSLGELVLERPGRSAALERYGLDYCCGGAARLDQACARKGVELAEVVAALETADAGPDLEDPAWMESLDSAIHHITATHHAYTREALPRLQRLAAKVARVHGDEDPRLRQLETVLDAFARETFEHMDKEERILFPMIQALAEGRRWSMPPTVQYPIACMLQEHEQHGARLDEFRQLTDGFAPPEGACGSWRALLEGLRELEEDLHRHIHKENSFLFPGAVGFERQAG
ncbi:MAG TPA: iron-sulfur cluster repair di-iron protein [Holophagaceae bacterium]|nr:iron-sulfur cluster repair di-iron protein [Holophagaceae bacterium]